MRSWTCTAVIGFVVWSTPIVTHAATVPDHEPLAVLVVADEVNPNQLSDAELTQPEDFATALQAEDSGLTIASVTTVDSQCADEALAALTGESPPDVVLYFAHRAAKSCDGAAVQEDLVTALSEGLENTTGIVVFHHGLYPDLYQAGAKDSMLQLVGGSFEGIAWNTTEGQRVFNVGADHFVSSNGLTYAGTATFAGVAGVTAGDYPYFDNIPDERYPNASLLTEPDEERTVLFASNTGGERVLGYVLSRPGWQRWVVAYQPGEYQPNALDTRDGNNFQILANALYFASRPADSVAPAPSGSGTTTDTSGPPDTSSTGASATDASSTASNPDDATSSVTDEENPTSHDETAPVPDGTTSANTATATHASTSSTAASTSATTTSAATSSAPSTQATQSPSTSAADSSSPNTTSDGCGCRLGVRDLYTARHAWSFVLGLIGLTFARRRHL